MTFEQFYLNLKLDDNYKYKKELENLFNYFSKNLDEEFFKKFINTYEKNYLALDDQKKKKLSEKIIKESTVKGFVEHYASNFFKFYNGEFSDEVFLNASKLINSLFRILYKKEHMDSVFENVYNANYFKETKLKQGSILLAKFKEEYDEFKSIIGLDSEFFASLKSNGPLEYEQKFILNGAEVSERSNRFLFVKNYKSLTNTFFIKKFESQINKVLRKNKFEPKDIVTSVNQFKYFRDSMISDLNKELELNNINIYTNKDRYRIDRVNQIAKVEDLSIGISDKDILDKVSSTLQCPRNVTFYQVNLTNDKNERNKLRDNLYTKAYDLLQNTKINNEAEALSLIYNVRSEYNGILKVHKSRKWHAFITDRKNNKQDKIDMKNLMNKLKEKTHYSKDSINAIFNKTDEQVANLISFSDSIFNPLTKVEEFKQNIEIKDENINIEFNEKDLETNLNINDLKAERNIIK